MSKQNKASQKTSPNASAKAIRVNEQTELFATYPFSPRYPTASSLEGKALSVLVSGKTLTHPQFMKLSDSWRLAIYIGKLIHELGWSIQKEKILAPIPENPHRYIAKYYLPSWALVSLNNEVAQ